MFIKHGDGKIMTVITEEDLTDEQKKSVNTQQQSIKKSTNDSSDTSEMKKSGR